MCNEKETCPRFFQAPQDIKKTVFNNPTPNQPMIRNEKYKNTKNTSTLVHQGSSPRTKDKSLQNSNIILVESCVLYPKYVPIYMPKIGKR